MDQDKQEEMVGCEVVDARDPLSIVVEMRGEEIVRLRRIDWQTFAIAGGVFACAFILAEMNQHLRSIRIMARGMGS